MSGEESIVVSGWRIVGAKGRRHVEFCIAERDEGGAESAITWRRWSSFKSLQRRLARRFPGATPPLSTDAWRRHLDDPDFLLQRQRQLAGFLDAILRHPGIRGSQEVWSFLLCDTPSASASEPPEASDVTIEGETSNGELLVSSDAGRGAKRHPIMDASPGAPRTPPALGASARSLADEDARAPALVVVPPEAVATPQLSPPARAPRPAAGGAPEGRAGVPAAAGPGARLRSAGGPSRGGGRGRDEELSSVLLTLLCAAFIVASTCYPPETDGLPALPGFPRCADPGPCGRAARWWSALSQAGAYLRALLLTLSAMALSMAALLRVLRGGANGDGGAAAAAVVACEVDAMDDDAIIASATQVVQTPLARVCAAEEASGEGEGGLGEGGAEGEGEGAGGVGDLRSDLEAIAGEGTGAAALPRVFTDAYLGAVLAKKGRSYAYTRSKLSKCLRFRREMRLDPGPAALSAETLEVLSSGCLYWHGFDRAGRPIIWAHPSRVDWHAHGAKAFVEAVAVLWDYGLQAVPEGVTQFVYLECTHGGGWESAPITKVLRVVKHGLDLLLTGYPDRVHSFHIAPTTSLNRFIFRFSSPFLPASVRDKMNMVGDAADALRDHVEGLVGRDRLPDFYGGAYEHPFAEGRFDFKAMMDFQRKAAEAFKP